MLILKDSLCHSQLPLKYFLSSTNLTLPTAKLKILFVLYFLNVDMHLPRKIVINENHISKEPGANLLLSVSENSIDCPTDTPGKHFGVACLVPPLPLAVGVWAARLVRPSSSSTDVGCECCGPFALSPRKAAFILPRARLKRSQVQRPPPRVNTSGSAAPQ